MAGIVFPIAYKVDDADLKNAEGAFKGFAGRIGGILAGLGIANLIGDAIKTGFSEVTDAAAGVAQLEAGIKSTGNAAGVTVSGMEALAASIQGYSGQTDDSIVKTEQLLLTFTNIKNQGPDKIFDAATKAAADMAAKMGGDASSSAIQLGKALNDPTAGITALTRVGVSFTDAQKEQIKALQASGDTLGAQKIILGELNKEFGGAAEAAGKSLPGQIEIMKRSFEDVTQNIVGAFMPVIQSTIGMLQDLVKWVGQNKDLVTSLAVAIGIGVAAFTAYKVITEGVALATKAWAAIQTVQALVTGEATLAQIGLNTALLANPIGIVIAAVAALVAGLVWFFTQTDVGKKAWAGFVGFLTDSWNLFMKTNDVIIKAITATFQGFIKWITGAWNGMVDSLGVAVKAIGDFFAPVFKFIGGLIKGYINGWIDLFEGFVNGIITGLNGVITLANAALSLIAKATGGAVTLKVPTIPKVNIPNFATGGIVPATPGGRLINVAEAGEAEAIVPLSKMGSMGGGATVNITVNAGLGTNGATIAQDIIKTIKQYERTNGAVWLGA
jgi:hypothetical protein